MMLLWFYDIMMCFCWYDCEFRSMLINIIKWDYQEMAFFQPWGKWKWLSFQHIWNPATVSWWLGGEKRKLNSRSIILYKLNYMTNIVTWLWWWYEAGAMMMNTSDDDDWEIDKGLYPLMMVRSILTKRIMVLDHGFWKTGKNLKQQFVRLVIRLWS